MTAKIKYISLIAALFLIDYSAKGQDYNYQFQDTTETYVSLVDSTKTLITNFDEIAFLPIGFSFNYAGEVVDSLHLRSNGLLLFDDENKFNFTFLNKEFFEDSENENYPTSLSYSVETDSYNHKIMKIEFKNVMLIRGEEIIHLNFQVWLHQYTNAVEFRMGAIQGTMPAENYTMGLINMDNTYEAALGYLLQGNATTPTGFLIPALGNLVELSTLPSNGTVYKFTPAN